MNKKINKKLNMFDDFLKPCIFDCINVYLTNFNRYTLKEAKLIMFMVQTQHLNIANLLISFDEACNISNICTVAL